MWQFAHVFIIIILLHAKFWLVYDNEKTNLDILKFSLTQKTSARGSLE